MSDPRRLTTAAGHPVGDNQNSKTVGPRGCPVHTYHRDGAMRFDDNGGIGPNYEPNSFGGPKEDPSAREPFRYISGEVGRHNHREGNDDYRQAGNLFRLMTAQQRTNLIQNIVGSMKLVPKRIQERQIDHFLKADPEYGQGVAEGLGIEVAETAKA